MSEIKSFFVLIALILFFLIIFQHGCQNGREFRKERRHQRQEQRENKNEENKKEDRRKRWFERRQINVGIVDTQNVFFQTCQFRSGYRSYGLTSKFLR